MQNVCVIGMGFVGLTLSAVLADKGFTVYGVERNPQILDSLNRKQPHFYEKGLNEKLASHAGKKMFFSSTVPAHKMDVFIITVGTPINKEKNTPLMDQIEESARIVSQSLSDQSLVILRSTVSVGTTREIVLPILKKSNKKFYLAFCPERTIEGNALLEIEELPQIVGGMDSESAEVAKNFFSKVTNEVVLLSSLEAAEMVKLLNNSWRDLTFAFANEVSGLCVKTALDANEIIHAANHKYKRSAIPTPGYAASKIPIGGFVGGFCLRKDPHLLIASGEKNGVHLDLIETSRRINHQLPSIVANRIAGFAKDPSKKIFLLGFGFKGEPETDDTRDSPTIDLVTALQTLGYTNLYGHDFLVKPEIIQSLKVKPVSIEDGFENAAVVVFCTNSKRYAGINISTIVPKMQKNGLVFDSWQIFDFHEPVFSDVSYQSIGRG